jgi:Cytochrome c oxidase subunit IV
MRANAVMFGLLGIFFGLSAVLYIVWNIIVFGAPEPVGSVVLILSTVLGLFLAFYLQRSYSSQGGPLPEDRVDANIDDGDPELGHFSPWSWWPVMLGAGAALVMVGLAVGFWICYIGVAFSLMCLIGWVYEYYRGYFAR